MVKLLPDGVIYRVSLTYIGNAYTQRREREREKGGCWSSRLGSQYRPEREEEEKSTEQKQGERIRRMRWRNMEVKRKREERREKRERERTAAAATTTTRSRENLEQSQISQDWHNHSRPPSQQRERQQLEQLGQWGSRAYPVEGGDCVISSVPFYLLSLTPTALNPPSNSIFLRLLPSSSFYTTTYSLRNCTSGNA